MTSGELKAENYTDLLVWQKGMDLVKETYTITRTFPADEKFGLVAQMRRAAVSILPTLQRAKRATRPENSCSLCLTQKVRSRSCEPNF